MRRDASRVLLAVVLSACGGEDGMDPDAAEVALVDRFGEAGTLFSRDADPSLPAAGEPVDFDQMITRGLGPDGQTVTYYNLDVQEREPMVAYELVDADGVPVDGQLPIVDALPGQQGYTDFWRLTRVTVPGDYVANTIVSAEEVQSSGYATEQTELIVNRPLVPEGSTAAVRVGGGDTAARRAWIAGRVVYYLAFEEASLDPVPVGIFEGAVPLSYIFVTFNTNGDASSGFMTEPGTDQTHNVVTSIPGDEDYSPLWMVNVYDNAEFDDVTDEDSAFAATLLATADNVNCPLRTVD